MLTQHVVMRDPIIVNFFDSTDLDTHICLLTETAVISRIPLLQSPVAQSVERVTVNH